MPYGQESSVAVQRTLYTGLIRYRDIIEPYMPYRCVRQLGYVQCVPRSITRPLQCHRPWKPVGYNVKYDGRAANEDWESFPLMHMLILSQLQPSGLDRGACDPAYLTWYSRHSHPRFYPDRAPRSVPPRSNSNYVSFFRHSYLSFVLSLFVIIFRIICHILFVVDG